MVVEHTLVDARASFAEDIVAAELNFRPWLSMYILFRLANVGCL